jgi:hypothetical protein
MYVLRVKCGHMYAVVYTHRSEDSFHYASSPSSSFETGFLSWYCSPLCEPGDLASKFPGILLSRLYMGSGIQTRVFVLLSQVLYSRRHPSAKTIILVHVDLARTLPIITSNYSSFSSEVLNRGWLSFSSCPLPGPGVLGNFWK